LNLSSDRILNDDKLCTKSVEPTKNQEKQGEITFAC
jgi:hypothetical protein